MTLTTAATVTFGRLQYTSQVRSVTAELGTLPGINRSDVVIAAGVQVDAEPGTDASVELDGGDGAATVITGTVDLVARDATGTLVSITDGSAALAAVRPQETYNSMLAMQIIAELANLAGVDTGLIVATTQTSAYVADPRRTAAQHLAALADLAGGVATIAGDGRLTVAPWPVGLPTAAMRRDREFTALSTSIHRPQHEFAFVGGGGSGVAAAPDAWLLASEAITNAAAPDPTRTWKSNPVLRTSTDVDLANRSEKARRAATTRKLRGDCWLQPARRPGDVIQIQETHHDDEGGPWLITSVQHVLAWDRSATVLHGVAAGDTSSLLGAIGGLL